jgi:hypothetical protein
VNKETKAGDDGEEVRKNGENPISLEKYMSEKFNDVNDEKFSSNLNDVNKKIDLNDVEKKSSDGILCGPESFGKEKGKMKWILRTIWVRA